jgi:nucleoredoxin
MGENWLSLPYDARDQKEKLSKAFGVNGIPSLVLLDSEANGRNTITTSGRSFVMENCVEDFPRSWAPKPYADLCKTAECKGSSINDEKALCVFVHQLEDKNVDGLKALASKNEKTDTLFFYATADEGIAEQVVRLCDIKPPKGEATLVLLDLDDDGAGQVSQ